MCWWRTCIGSACGDVDVAITVVGRVAAGVANTVVGLLVDVCLVVGPRDSRLGDADSSNAAAAGTTPAAPRVAAAETFSSGR